MGLNDKAEYERRARTIPLRRLGREGDNAEAVAFLLSPEASFINGEYSMSTAALPRPTDHDTPDSSL
jgi:NAD(P)-dependent dehydrogenase (short-subunit alcohol dehydrogenase family)